MADGIDARHVELLRHAAGLIVREAGILSHAGVLCRELGLPAIVSAQRLAVHNVGDRVTLAAGLGLVRREAHRTEAIWAHPKRPVLQPPGKATGVAEVSIAFDNDLWARLPIEARRAAMRLVTVPGVRGTVRVSPDLRAREAGIGFPSGVAFDSVRFHPTAVCDIGDGLRLMEIRGLHPAVIKSRAAHISRTLDRRLTAVESLSKAEVKRLCVDGITALEAGGGETTSDQGRVPFADPDALPEMVIGLLSRTWGKRDALAGHFLDLSEVRRPSDPLTTEVAAILHSGCDTAGRSFLRWSRALAAEASMAEGADDDASIAQGYFGCNIGSLVGDRLAVGAFALMNFAYARRMHLQQAIEEALTEALGQPISISCRSDWVHSSVVPAGDVISYQQGTQRLSGSDTAALVITAGPASSSYVVRGTPLGLHAPPIFLPHGKASVDVTYAEIQDAGAPPIPHVYGPVFGSDWREASATPAQALISVRAAIRSTGIDLAHKLSPLLSFRGSGTARR